MFKKLLIFGAIPFCVVVLILVYIKFIKASSPDIEVLMLAEEMDSHCPVMIDFETRLDKVNALADNTLHFNCSFIYSIKDSLSVDKLKNNLEPIILNNIKRSPILSKYLDKNLTWIYSYYDKRGDFIFKLTYTPDQFK
jgi:hypothetical protein